MCNCIDLVNEQHKDKNTKLVTTIPWYANTPLRIILMTEKVDDKNRKKPISLMGAYCPFCGKDIASDMAQDGG